MKKFLLAGMMCFALNTLLSQTVFKDYIDGELYVKFASSALKQVSKEDPNNIPFTKITSVNKILSKYGVTKASKPFYQASDDAKLPYILKFEFSQKSQVGAFIGELSRAPGVEYAEKVPAMTTFTTPNDPSYGLQGFLPQINAPNAWTVFNGTSNIVVAVVDNAVKYDHADLIANTYTNMIEAAGLPGVDDDGNGYVDDIYGYDVADNDNNPLPPNNTFDHGTHCAGIVGARNNNAVGIASIGWNLKILPVKATLNASPPTAVNNGYGGIIYAAKSGAKVISCSWGGAGGGAAGQSVIDYAWSKGCIIIASAGNNNNSTPNYPGAYNNVYCVASCNSSNVKSSFSNFGQVSNPWVDITAPGNSIYSTIPSGYGYMSGTSMATPLVAGLAGLMLSKSPLMTQQDVLNCISSTAVNIYTIAANATYSASQQLGAGRIEAFAAMNCAAAFLNAPPVANFFTLTKNTCPNVPIAFQDSSLYAYAPASWSWTFQAGTPSVSTSSNPTVQWNTPGTYSVAMSITTPNGNSQITKISYITIAGPVALPLTEGFQTLPFLPPNWTQYNFGNDNVYWARTTTCGGFGTSTACAMFDNANQDAGGDRDEMRTPKYIFSNVVSAKLYFDVAYKFLDNTYSDTLSVKVSTNCGISWTNIYNKGGTTLATTPGTAIPLFIPSASEWRKDSVDITALTAGQGNVMLSFVNHGHYGQGLYVDNINIKFPAPAPNFAVPPPVCAGTAVTYTNNSSGAANYSWAFQGGSPATSTMANPVVTYSAGGVFMATLTAFNGTTAASITKTISINGTPTIAVNNQTICSGVTTTINASGAVTYSWSTGFVGNPLVVSPATNTVYSVTGNSLGCTGSNTVSVTIGSFLSVFISPSQPTLCAGGTSSLSASGAANYTWNTGSNAANIVVSPTTSSTYSIIGTIGSCTGTTALTVNVVPPPAITINIAPSGSICPGNTATLTASGSYSSFTWATPTVVASSISVSPASTTNYTVSGTEAGGCNSSSVVTLFVNAAPVAVTNATNASCDICPDGFASISASGGVGPYTYLWLPGNSTQTMVSGSPKCFTVTVTDANGCAVQNTVCIEYEIINGLNQMAHSSAGLKIYPNPAHNYVMIDFQGAHFDCSIFNALGQLVIQKNNNHNLSFMMIEELAKGVYTIEIQKGDDKIRKKLIIN